MNSGRIIRLCLIGLPVGLVAFGIMSVFFTHFADKTDNEEEKIATKRSQAAGIMRKAVNEGDLERYLGILTDDIGERNLESAYDNLKTAAYWVESTIGQSNMGYPVRKQKFQAGGKEIWNVIAEQPGTTRPDEIVVIGATYDSPAGSKGIDDKGTGVAALLSLANAFSGTETARTLRFVAFANGQASSVEELGAAAFAETARNDGDFLVATLCLESLGRTDDSGTLVFVAGGESGELAAQAKVAFQQSVATKAGFKVEIRSADVGPAGETAAGANLAFEQAGYRVVTATTAGSPPGTVESIDLARLAAMVKGLQAVVKAWANP